MCSPFHPLQGPAFLIRAPKDIGSLPSAWAMSSALCHFDVLVPFLGFVFQFGISAWIQEYQQVTGQTVVKLIFSEKRRSVGKEDWKIKI